MRPTNDDIKEIAELLDCGELCFFHKLTGTIEHHPDPDNAYFESEFWQDIVDKIETNKSDYLKFEKMDSRQDFRIMENFVNSLTDDRFRSRLFSLLSERKPFSKFKWAIDNSAYRQNWFDFKESAYIEWVQEQLKSTGEVE